MLAFGPNAPVADVPVPPGKWRVALDSAEPAWLGPGGAAAGAVTSTGVVELRLADARVIVLLLET